MNEFKFQTDITLKSIHYTGKTIGREFAIEITINGETKLFNKRLAPNSVNLVDDLIYRKSFKSPVKCNILVNILEKDSNPDEGSANLSLNFSQNTKGKFPVDVSIIENGSANNNGNECKLRFIFEVSTIELGRKTLVEVDEKGWIKGRLVNNDGIEGKEVTLHYGTLVDHYRTEFDKNSGNQYSGKEYFKILEGKNKGDKARLLIPKDKKTRLKSNFKYKSPCYVEYTYKEVIENKNGKFVIGNVKVKGISTVFKAFSLYKDCLPVGEYYLEVPDEPHPGGASYEKICLLSKSWFRIIYPAKPKSAYYFHLGTASNGCITVYTPDVNPADTWTKIYNHIVTCRLEGKLGIIGKVKVINEIK